jgi:hypothetical protein
MNDREPGSACTGGGPEGAGSRIERRTRSRNCDWRVYLFVVVHPTAR